MPSGSHIAAIFDFDGTLIAGYSATVFLKEQLKRGDLSARDFLELSAAMTNFGLGNLGFSGLMLVTSQLMRGMSEQNYIEFGEELYTKQIARLIYPESRALVEAHRAKGHTIAVISSATPYQVEPAARGMDIDHVMCSQLEVEGGVFTGGVIRPTCFGQGKVDAAEDLAARLDLDLDASAFYSDSYDDIELLERVGNPVVLNASSKLTREAQHRSWPSARFGSRGRASLSEFLRSVAATWSLVPSFAAGLPMWALTGSRRDAQNFSFSVFADSASALIGLQLDVKGEEHLWSHRPAVFVFNHQSKADIIITARLLRRDIAGIGKQEIKKLPVLGKVLEFGGIVYIDRSNSASAIDAMTPLVDAMRNEGKSVVLAPEGTRTISPKLGPFKKGDFHLAMQAGVPIVPIVIRNAGDVAPKGDFVFRAATVEVEVLEPVDTSAWDVSTIDQHVDEVRGLFLQALGQDSGAKRVKSKGKAKVKKPAAKKAATKKQPAKKVTKKKVAKKNVAKKKETVEKKEPAKKASAKTAVKKKAVKKPATKADKLEGKKAPAKKSAKPL
jgi:putative phosphoserine phosphatase/1-acylglycerol-3-phosphate O-acyltransferase